MRSLCLFLLGLCVPACAYATHPVGAPPSCHAACQDGGCAELQLRWARALGAQAGGFSALAVGASGDLFAAATVTGTVNAGTGALRGGDRGDPLLARYDGATGAPRWVRRFSDPSADATTLSDLAVGPGDALWTVGVFAYRVDLGGGPLLAGSFLAGLLAGYDAQGNHRYSRAFTNPPGWSRGASPDNRFEGVAVSLEGDVVVGGNVEQEGVFEGRSLRSTSIDGVLGRLTSAGAVRWLETFGDGSSATVRAVALTPGGDALVTGLFSGRSPLGGGLEAEGSFDTFVARVDPEGAVRWARRLGGSGEDLPRGIAVDVSGRAYVVGTSSAGLSPSLAGGTRPGLFLSAYSAEGALRWVAGFEPPASSRAEAGLRRVAVSPEGEVYVGGAFRGPLRVGDRTLADTGHRQGLLASFSAEGVLRWARAVSASGDASVEGLGLAPCGAVAVAGTFAGTLALGAGLSATGRVDGYVAVLER